MSSARGSGGDRSLYFLILGRRVRIDCAAPAARALLAANFGTMAAGSCECEPPDLRYTVSLAGATFSIVRGGLDPLSGVGLGELLYLLEKDLTVRLQELRPELLFLHSAAVECAGKAYLFAAEA